jgi:Protein of unknown function (DUF3489)
MSKPTPKQKTTSSPLVVPSLKSTQKLSTTPGVSRIDPESKQSRVIALLQSPKGATSAAIMKVTGWQQHSVRGFLAGVVRKRLKLKLDSRKENDVRVYRIANGVNVKRRSSKSKPHAR